MNEVLGRIPRWDVDEDFVLPRPAELVAGAGVKHVTVHLDDTYYDTVDGDLQAQGVLLRRRDGDGDTGWQLKVPGVDNRVEIGSPVADTVPDELADMLTGMRLGKPLVSVAKIRTRRERYRIGDPTRRRGDSQVTQITDDRVRASMDHRLLSWREIEVQLGPEAKTLSRRLADRLAAAGASPCQRPSKLARVRRPAAGPVDDNAAESALRAYTTAQIDRIFTGDLDLRRGIDPIHDTRVAIRRLRSTLRVFGKLLDRDAVGGADDELKWFAGLLGDVRDCQVQRRRFQAALADLPPELVMGPVGNRFETDLLSDQLQARGRVTEAMNSPRYLDLLKKLHRWRTDLPIATAPTPKALTKRARRAQRKADRRLARAVRAGDDELLHRARKAVKRARYAAELRTVLDRRAKRTAKHYKRFQRVLGDHQDGVVASETLRRLARVAGTTPGENGFTYGMLFAREQHAAQEARRRARDLLD